MLLNAISFFVQSSYRYEYTSSSSETDSGAAAVFVLVYLCCIFGIILLAYVYQSYCLMIIAERTGHGDSKMLAWIPIASNYLMVQIAKKDILWFILFFIPFANIVAAVVVWMEIANQLGKPTWWGILTITPVGIIVPGYLAFSK